MVKAASRKPGNEGNRKNQQLQDIRDMIVDAATSEIVSPYAKNETGPWRGNIAHNDQDGKGKQVRPSELFKCRSEKTIVGR
jgi:hypothetical protein